MKKNYAKIVKRFIFGLALCLAVLFSAVFLVQPNDKRQLDDSYATSAYLSGLASDSSDIESKFNLTQNYPIMPENQTTSNLCWIYSSLKVLESSLMVQKNEYYNFSDVGMAYLAYTSGIKNSINATGIFEDFSTLVNQQGLVYQSDVSNDIYFDINTDNYKNYDYILDKTSRNVIDSVDSLNFSEDGTFKQLTRAKKAILIKRYIKKYGGIFAGLADGILYRDGVYIYTTQTSLEAEKVYLNGNHAVCLVGWDDRFGFLALNSWGDKCDEFYIPYDYEAVYDTFFGYICDESEDVELIETTASNMTSYTHYGNQLANMFSIDETISVTYNISNNINMQTIYTNIFKGTENVTNYFDIKYDESARKVTITQKKQTGGFLGGSYLIKFYDDLSLASVKNLFVYSGTEVNYFELQKDNMVSTVESQLLMSSFLTSDNSVTYYLSPLERYFLRFGLANLNDTNNTKTSLYYEVSKATIYTLSNGNESTQEIDIGLTKELGIFADASNSYQINIPNLYEHRGCLVKFSITINSTLSNLSSYSQTYYVNIFVSNSETKLTQDAYSIEYVLDGGLNSVQNVERYPIYSQESSMTGVKLKAPTKDGTTFIGWYRDSSFTQEVLEINSSLSEDIVLYALWETDDIDYFESSLALSKITTYEGESKALTEKIIYGDSVEFKINFKPLSGLNGFNYYTRYYYYLNGEECEIAEIPNETQNIFKTLNFEELKVGTYEIEVEVVVVISHNKSVLKRHKLNFEVEQKEILFEYKDTSIEYDGAEHNIKISVMNNTIYSEDAESFEFEVLGGMNSQVGTYDYSVLSINNDNYTFDKTKTCKLTINPKTLSVEWSNMSATYDATEKKPTYKLVGVVDGDNVSVDLVSKKMIEADTYLVSVDPETVSSKNYKLDDNFETEFEITPAWIEITFNNAEDRVETSPVYREQITYRVEGTLYDNFEKLNLKIICEAINATKGGNYVITGDYENTNYVVKFNDALYVLLGDYYVYYTLPNGELYIEKVEAGNAPKGINNDIYKINGLQKYEYSEELINKNEDMHILVTIKDNTWIVVASIAAVIIVAIYWFATRKQRRNKVS